MDEIYTYGFDLAVEEWNPTEQFFFKFPVAPFIAVDYYCGRFLQYFFKTWKICDILKWIALQSFTFYSTLLEVSLFYKLRLRFLFFQNC